MATGAKKRSKKRAPRTEEALPRPPWLDSQRLSERFAYPSYAHHAAVRELAQQSAERDDRARIDALIEQSVARGLISSTWMTGGAPRCIGPCDKCGTAGFLPDGTILSHRPGCPEEDRPHALEFAVSLVAEACVTPPRGAVIDAEALAAEWMSALVAWGASPFRGVYWSYEAHPPALLVGWDGVCELQPVLVRAALAAARVLRPKPTLWYSEASAPGYGALGDVSWMVEVFEPIDREARGRKKPGRPRRTVFERELEMLGYALEGASLWHAAIEANLEVVAAPKSRRPTPLTEKIPRALEGKKFSALANPWPALLALLATGALPVGASGGWLALNLARWETA